MNVNGILASFAIGCFLMLAVSSCAVKESPLSAVPSAASFNARSDLKSKSHAFPASKREGGLLYISDNKAQKVGVYTYPGLKLVRVLNNFSSPSGLCSDQNGNVFITDAENAEIVEYAHGGKRPVNILSDSGAEPNGCSVDPVTGNLAVANIWPQNVAVYQGAQGTPVTYAYSGAEFWYPAYDNSGNLFVTGFPNTYLLELAKNGNSLVQLAINKPLKTGYAQWDGTYLAVESLPHSKDSIRLDRLSITGNGATVVSTVSLRSYGLRRLYSGNQYWIQGSAVIGGAGINRHGYGLAFWNYPDGGKQTALKKTAYDDYGATVSVTPSASALRNRIGHFWSMLKLSVSSP